MKLYDNDSYRDEFMNGVYALLSSDPTCDRANQIIDLFDHAPAVETTIEPPNDPLTVEELRKMDGEPYWHVSLKDASHKPHWALLPRGIAKHPQDYGYGVDWLAYRRKLEA